MRKIKGLTASFKGLRVPQTHSVVTVIPSSSFASLRAVATTSLSEGSFFPPAKLHKNYILDIQHLT